jgi:hypothetical protein
MPNTWQEALLSYRYPVDLRSFSDAHQFPGWFYFDLGNGDRSQTIEFELHFRKHAQKALEPWLEVVYWKLYSQLACRDRITRQVSSHFRQGEGNLAKSLWQACNKYICNKYKEPPKRANFDSFRRLFGFSSQGIAVVATFPAFINPASCPMVDTRIAKWVGNCMTAHNEADRIGPQLIRPPFCDSNRTVLTMADYEFMQHWNRWCVYTAQKLTKLTPINWRARDVEMAVFYAWGTRRGRRCNHDPMVHLNPLPNIEGASTYWSQELPRSTGSEIVPEINGPHFWGQQVPHTGVIPPAANVYAAVQDYLRLESFENLPPWKMQNLRDLHFKDKQSDLRELLQNPGGKMARQFLQNYRERGGGRDIRNLPRPILDVFLVGWAYSLGHHRPSDMATHLHASCFGGTRNAAQAAVYVGRTTGRLFGLLDDAGIPTPFFHGYFGV